MIGSIINSKIGNSCFINIDPLFVKRVTVPKIIVDFKKQLESQTTKVQIGLFERI